jgi:hypothetical protein
MKRTGNTIVEIAIAAGIIGIVVLGFALFQTASVKANQRERDRAFAMQKCIQMMEELKAKVAGNANTSLDDYGQADTTFDFKLTSDTAITIPSQPLSDNVPEAKGYRFVRQIWVRPLPRDKGARQVTIRVFRSDDKATPGVKAGALPLATLANVFKSTPNVVLPTQQYDVYSIGCVENSLGKWDSCAYSWADANEGYQSASVSYLSAATSGLSMISRPIRLTSYGRDTYYSPLHNAHDFWTYYYNNSRGAVFWNYNNVPLHSVYFRPGETDWWYILNPGQGQSNYWYTPTVADGAEPDAPTRYPVLHGNTAQHLYKMQPAYTFADQYNHSLRYAEYKEKQAVRGVTSSYLGQTYGQYRWWPDPYELTLRGLLDEMLEGGRKNAILVNNHGQLFPFIPMRNYSDAAKVPDHEFDLPTLASQWGVSPASATEAKDGSHCRLVTHPRQLEYNQGDIVELRTYPYLADPQYDDNLYATGQEPPAAYRDGTIVLRGMGSLLADWNPNGGPEQDVEIQYMSTIHSVYTGSATDQIVAFNPNMTPADPATYLDGLGQWRMDAYRWVRVWPPVNYPNGLVNTNNISKIKGKNTVVPYIPAIANNYVNSVTVQAVNDPANGLNAGDVVIKLKNINYTPDPFTGKEYVSKKFLNDVTFGLDKTRKLFGMHYFPDPELSDLSDGDDTTYKEPRNSARIRILFKTKQATTVEVLTTIGSDGNLLHHQAPNRSRTWAWVGTTAPETEKYQLLGDPRHNPYEDVRNTYRYNRYFDNLQTDAYINLDETVYDPSWNRFPDTADGWGPNVGSKGKADSDVPRYFELWRKALLKANAMLVTPTADAFQVLALGGEYGSWTHSKLPMTGEKNKGATYDEWKNPTLIASKDKKWCNKPWLGEMHPDDEWQSWYNGGNLDSTNYRHMEYQDIDAFRNEFPGNVAFKRTKYLDHWGPMGFFNAQTQFMYNSAAGTATITGSKLPSPTDGRAMSSDLKALLTETFQTNRSFTLNDAAATPPDDWNMTESKNNRTTLEYGLTTSGTNAYYLAADGAKAVAPFVMRRNGEAAYFIGFTPWNAWSGANDPYTISRVLQASILQGYLDMASPKYANGNQKGAARIRLLPRLNVTKPEDDALVTGSSCAIEWTPEWTRWDGNPYSRQFSTYGATGDEPTLSYVVKYSEDGKYWYLSNGKYISTQIGANARFDTNAKAVATTSTTLTLNTAGFKNKQYQVRVEAWRSDAGYESVHHSYAQFSINYTK